jgi:tetratricopeptide (TPR) repeat protein
MRSLAASLCLLLASLGAHASAPRPIHSAEALRPTQATTDGAIALGNLQAQIDSEERIGRSRPLTVAQRSGIAELVSLRGQFLGRIADYERCEELAEQLVRDEPNDGASYLARASARATFHRFDAAREDLDRAEQLGANAASIASSRAAILQATGRVDDAMEQRERAARERPTISSISALASAHAERGDVEEADRLFGEALDAYRDVSPFPVAWALAQRGLLWQREGELERARASFLAAHETLPQFVLAQGHLAEVEAALGHADRAVALLRPLVIASDDPDYAAQLARILEGSGHHAEAQRWRDAAAERFEQLLARHPEAFADHAAELLLGVGGDPVRGFALAKENLCVRRTGRALELVLQGAIEVGDVAATCDVLADVQALHHQWPALRALALDAGRECGASAAGAGG